jgi:hypothetical protein
MTEDQKETAVIVASVATIGLAALAVGKIGKVLTRVTMSRKFDRQVDATVASK